MLASRSWISILESLAPERLRTITGREFDEMCRIGLFDDEHVMSCSTECWSR